MDSGIGDDVCQDCFESYKQWKEFYHSWLEKQAEIRAEREKDYMRMKLNSKNVCLCCGKIHR